MKKPELLPWMSNVSGNGCFSSHEMALIYKTSESTITDEYKAGRMPAPDMTIDLNRENNHGPRNKWRVAAVRLDVAKRQRAYDQKQREKNNG